MDNLKDEIEFLKEGFKKKNAQQQQEKQDLLDQINALKD